MTIPAREINMAAEQKGDLNNIQDLLRRKREFERNKRRLHLTEADCSLLLTNANEFTFNDRQIIAQEGDALTSIYRVKHGTVVLMKDDLTICEFSQVCVHTTHFYASKSIKMKYKRNVTLIHSCNMRPV